VLSLPGQTEEDSGAFIKSVYKEGKFVREEEFVPNFLRKAF